MNAIRLFAALVLFLALAVAGCQREATKAKETTHDIKGKVVAVEPEKKKVTLDHEDIPGLMKAMKMDFSVDDAKVLEGIQPGDEVRGRLRAGSGKYVITELSKE